MPLRTASPCVDTAPAASAAVDPREALAAAEAATRRAAVHALAGGTDASPLLAARLRIEPDALVREALLDALARGADRVALDALTAALRSEDVPLRNAAIEALRSVPATTELLVGELLVDADADVRLFAVNALESLRHPDIETWLVDVLECDPNVNVCAAALDLMAEAATPASRGALVRMRARFPEHPFIAFAADLALARIGAPE